MKKFLEAYKVCLKTVLARAMAYRMNFIVSMVLTLCANIVLPLVTLLIYEKGASFPGWSFWEVLLIQGIYTLSTGIAAGVFEGVTWATMDHIREGSFEIVLLKPISPIGFLMVTNIYLESIGVIIGGIVMIGLALSHIESVTLVGVCQFALLFVAGLGVSSGLFLIMAAISFKWIGNSRIPELFESVKNFGKYPICIFPKFIQGITTFVIPVAMIAYFPASALLGKTTLLGMLTVLPCMLFFVLGIGFYKKMIAIYEGVGG